MRLTYANMWISDHEKTSQALCDPGGDLSLRDTRFLLSRGSCAASKLASQWEFCAALGVGIQAQQLKPRKMAPGMLHSSCYCWLIGIWEVRKVILNAKNGTLKRQLLVLSSERPGQQKGVVVLKGATKSVSWAVWNETCVGSLQGWACLREGSVLGLIINA